MAALLDQRQCGIPGPVEDLSHVEPLPAQQDLSGVDARHVQQVIDEMRQLPGLAPDDARRPGAILRVFAVEQRGSIGHRRERIAQFMRQHGQELILATIHFAQRFLVAAAL